MHQYCNIHSPPLDAHVLINPPTSALGFPNNGHIFTNHYLGLATSSLQFTLHSAFKHLGWLEFVFHQRAFHQLLLGHVCDIFKKAKTKIGWMKVRNVIWIWKPVQCVVNSQLCPSGILKEGTIVFWTLLEFWPQKQQRCINHGTVVICFALPKTQQSDDANDDWVIIWVTRKVTRNMARNMARNMVTGEELYKKDGEQVGQNIDNDDNELSAPFTLFDSLRTSEVEPIKIRRDFRQLNAVLDLPKSGIRCMLPIW